MIRTSVPSTAPHRPGLRRPRCIGIGTATCVALIALVGRGEDDQIVDDAVLMAAEFGPQADRGEGNVVDLSQQFDSNLLGNVLGPDFFIPGGRVIIRGQVAGNVRIVMGQGHGMQQPADAPDRSGRDSPIVAALRKLTAPWLTRIETICSPTADQRRLLHLALESDLRQLSGDLERLRQKYAGVKVNIGTPEGQKVWQQFNQDMQRGQKLLQTLDQSGAGLFDKVQATVLEGEQFARLEAESEARLAHRWRVLVALQLDRWDDMLGFDQRQHDGLEALLIAKRPPLRTRGSAHNPHMTAPVNQAAWLVPLALSQVDEKQLRSVVDGRQWTILQRQILHAKQNRQSIEQMGFLEGTPR